MASFFVIQLALMSNADDSSNVRLDYNQGQIISLANIKTIGGQVFPGVATALVKINELSSIDDF